MDKYSNDLLGRNIHYLRQLYGETLEEMGSALHLGATAIKNYETGIRFPDLPKIRSIAHHFGRTVEELLTCDLSALDTEARLDLTAEEAFRQINAPGFLQITEEAMENGSFRTAIRMLIQLSRNKDLSSEQMIARLQAPIWFFEKAEEDGVAEATANILWTMVVQISFLVEPVPEDTDILTFLAQMDRLYRQPEIQARKEELLSNIREPFFERIKTLKKTEGWQELGDYYLSFWFSSLEPDNGRSPETNQLIANEWFRVLLELENPYALSLFQENEP